MTESLRDLLLKSGIAKSVPKAPARSPRKRKPKPASTAADGELDLARAFALRASSEARERAAAKREAEAQARAKKEARRKLTELLDGKALNQADADRVRHFEYRGKIRRVYATAKQLAALNAGDLGIVQLAGNYLIVGADLARAAAAIDEHALALLVDPADSTGDDGVPDDLVW